MQVSFCFVVYPAVVITYLGQAAYLYSGDNNLDFDNTFYASIPTPVYWPMFVIAILAAIVASQVLISSTPKFTCQPHHVSRLCPQHVCGSAIWVLLLSFRCLLSMGTHSGGIPAALPRIAALRVSFQFCMRPHLRPECCR